MSCSAERLHLGKLSDAAVSWVGSVAAAGRDLHIAEYSSASQATYDGLEAAADGTRTGATQLAAGERLDDLGTALVTRSDTWGDALHTETTETGNKLLTHHDAQAAARLSYDQQSDALARTRLLGTTQEDVSLTAGL